MYEATARMKIRDGETDGFIHQIAEIMRQTREKDTKTLRYDWFVSEDGAQCEVREAYVDADGLLDHHFHIEEAKTALFRDFAYDHDMTFYADPSPALAELLEAMKGRFAVNQFAFLDGLGQHPTIVMPQRNGEASTIFEVTAQLRVREGQLAGFKEQIAAVMQSARERDTKTLRFDAFLSTDGSLCETREAYADADAFIEHQQHTGETRGKLLQQFVHAHSASFYSPPSPALAAMLEKMGGAVKINQYSFLQGLEADLKVPV
jgi:quinol monooxygenase YgiN